MSQSSSPEKEKLGFKKPPKAARFKRGQSGNPKGRPKGSKNKVSTKASKLEAMILQEANREVRVNDADGQSHLSVAETVIRSIALKAAKGNTAAQRHFLKTLSEANSKQEQERSDLIKAGLEFKTAAQAAETFFADNKMDFPDWLPRADQVEIDWSKGDLILRGPFGEADKRRWDWVWHFKALLEQEGEVLAGYLQDPQKADYHEALKADLHHLDRLRTSVDDLLREKWNVLPEDIASNRFAPKEISESKHKDHPTFAGFRLIRRANYNLALIKAGEAPERDFTLTARICDAMKGKEKIPSLQDILGWDEKDLPFNP